MATDSERLDWLEAHPGVINPEAAVDPSWNMEGFHDETDGWGSIDLNLWYPTLREAIDRAIELDANPHRPTPEGERHF